MEININKINSLDKINIEDILINKKQKELVMDINKERKEIFVYVKDSLNKKVGGKLYLLKENTLIEVNSSYFNKNDLAYEDINKKLEKAKII